MATLTKTIGNSDASAKPKPMSLFASLGPPGQGGPFALEAQYRADKDPNKVNLIIGAYRDDEAQPWPLSSVAEAKKRIAQSAALHEYPPLRGNAEFIDSARALVFGDDIVARQGTCISSIQTISGTGANTLIAKFLQDHAKPSNVWLPDPTWANHPDIWAAAAPGVTVRSYPYYNAQTSSLEFDGMLHCLEKNAHEGDAVLLHACAHNPTGLDPTEEQWDQIARVCEARKLFVVFDSAYQGFASGDLAKDAWAVRHFCEAYPTIELAVCQSFSKNLGLYGERVGALHVVVARDQQQDTETTAVRVQSHLVDLHRAFVSMAPLFGSRIAAEVMGSADLRELWRSDLALMSGRIKAMRTALYDELVKLKTPGSWEHIVRQTGMFSYTGLTPEQVAKLRTNYHVYMLPTGRASVAGMTSSNVQYTARAIHAVVCDSQKNV